MTSPQFKVVIPARMNSSRLPGKMLAEIAGLPLIIRVAHQARLSLAQQVIVATDHQQIAQVCAEHQIQVVMTNPEHQSGTDRIAEVVQALQLADDEIILNVQGDEPLIDPQLINDLAAFAATKQAAIATVAHPLHQLEDVFNPNIVKVVVNNEQAALYFSRAPIPYARDNYATLDQRVLPAQMPILRHIGIYAYQVQFLRTYHNLASCALEQVEALEQLRALYHGYTIAVLTTEKAPAAGVDTAADLELVRALIQKGN